MDPYGKNELITFYDRHLRDFGDHPQAVRWTPEGQRRRYEAFAEIAGDLSGKRVLDFGCGKGDFYGFLREKGQDPCYHGIDVNENLIELARNKFPGAPFIAADIEETDLHDEFEVIVACGVFNLRIGGIEESMRHVLRKLFSMCTEALHCNALSSHSYPRQVELHYVDPVLMLEFIVRELSPIVVLRHDTPVMGDIFFSVYRNS